MKKYIYIGAGGFLGAILRFLIESSYIFNYIGNIPLNTLLINITGSFLLSLILTITFYFGKINENVRLGITIGFLGAFTTFSTMCKEVVNLMIKQYYISAIFYITISTILGLLAAYLGVIVAREIIPKSLKEKG